MKAANSWITYRTRFLVQAKQLNNSLSFTDVLGRKHSGGKGDYLVESSEGVLSIAPRQIFEDIYVALRADEDRSRESENVTGPGTSMRIRQASPGREIRQIHVRQVELRQVNEIRRDSPVILAPHLMRKTPQSWAGVRPAAGLRSV